VAASRAVTGLGPPIGGALISLWGAVFQSKKTWAGWVPKYNW
jgi:hypothetical protein